MWVEARNLLQAFKNLLDSTDEANDEIFQQLQTKSSGMWKRPLRNRPQSAANKAQVSKVGSEICLETGKRVVLDESVKNEALIISDHFGMDELDALELVVAGDSQTSYCQLMRELLALRHKPLDTLDRNLHAVYSIAGDLLSDYSICESLIDAIAKFNLKSEFEALNKPSTNGLGGEKHQQVLRLLISDIEFISFEILCLFSLHASSDVRKQMLAKVVEMARQISPDPYMTHFQLTIWTTLLLIFTGHRPFQDTDTKAFKSVIDSSEWKNPCLKATILFGLAVSLKIQQQQGTLERSSTLCFDFDEQRLVTDAIENMAIEGLHAFIAGIPKLERYSFTIDVLDMLLKNFICRFTGKLSSLYIQCEEELRNLSEKDVERKANYANLHFKALVELIAAIYAKATPQLMAHCEEFVDPNLEELRNFLQLGRAIRSATLAVLFGGMLKTLCKTQKMANFLYTAFK